MVLDKGMLVFRSPLFALVQLGFVRACLVALLSLMLGVNVMAQNAGSGIVLDTLFAKLQTATDPVAIRTLEAAIWAENVPFHETRDYVKKVLSNTTSYAALLSGQPQSLKARLGKVAPREASAPPIDDKMP